MGENTTHKPPLPKLRPKREKYLRHICSYFTVDGKSGDEAVTYGQLCILNELIFRDSNRVQIITPTQYGKSLWVALAALIITCIQGKSVAIVAPSKGKAKIIMRYYIEHLADSKLFYSQLEQNTKLERLQQELSKERIVLRNGGQIFVVSAKQRNAKDRIEAAMGEGAEIVIGDEYGLISDDTEATIFRMIGGKENGFYCKIGNPFYATPPFSHFKDTWGSTLYKKIYIDYKIGIKEGRFTQQHIEEARTKPLFDVLYGCEFPPEDVQDKDGFRPLVVTTDIQFVDNADILFNALKRDWNAGKEEKLKQHKQRVNIEQSIKIDTGEEPQEYNPDGEYSVEPKLGVDISGGGDWNRYVLRWKNLSAVIAQNRSTDTMVQVSEIERFVEELHIKPENVNVDDLSMGRGVCDRCYERDLNVNPVSAGDKVADEEFYNLKAKLCWEARAWVKRDDTRFVKNEGFMQLTWLRYKVKSDKTIIMEKKEKLKARHQGQSPDTAEAFYLTFADQPFIGIV